MRNDLFRMGDKNLLEKPENLRVEETAIETKDIAVIGIAGRFPDARDVHAFWNNLQAGVDCTRPFLQTRRNDTDPLLSRLGMMEDGNDYANGSFLDRVDTFDCEFFSLSPKESSVMDPNQRIFLETAYEAFEDAGYGGNKLSGSNAGVYVGYSSDFVQEYKQYVKEVAPSLAGLSTPGNIKSIIASRISYFLNLRGASMVVDTACSSSLVAIHLACQALRAGDCEIALAGGIKLNLLPLSNEKDEDQIGIASSDGIARTFDDSSDGTGFGEGAAAVILKPLQQAVHDGDHIYAVIKGSAVNQDGSSVGITAPNPNAQQEVITSAWRDAGVTPETITYIEAHGTGTRLGDPIEIRAITQAFQAFTKSKQFCAIGSLKSNIGHLDNAAGIAGFMKCVLSLKHRKIVPTLHFQKPNRGIAFEDSPVYVNDQLRDWKSDGPLRCGVSAFGLSGTNCHIVLEEAPVRTDDRQEVVMPQIFTLSALNRSSIIQLAERYKAWIERNSDVSLSDMCYTLNTGRGHHTNRVAIPFEAKSELLQQLELLSGDAESASSRKLYFEGEHKVIPDSLGNRVIKPSEITQSQADELTRQADELLDDLSNNGLTKSKNALNQLCSLYVEGATVNWEKLYRGVKTRKVSLPYYPFRNRRCWLSDHEDASTYRTHPIISRSEAREDGGVVCFAELVPEKEWVLNEHKINGKFVLPGTAYLEIVTEASRKCGLEGAIDFRDVIFMQPVALEPGESATVKITMNKNKNGFEFVVSDPGDHPSILYAQGKVSASIHKPERRDIFTMIEKFGVPMEFVGDDQGQGQIERGPRWFCLREIALTEQEVIAKLELPAHFKEDLALYHMHPSLLDCAVNAVIDHFDGLHLPFSYKRMTFMGPSLPGVVYSHIRIIDGKSVQDTISFDITLMDEYGQVIFEIEQYSIRKVHLAEGRADRKNTKMLTVLGWQPALLQDTPTGSSTGLSVIIRGEGARERELADRLIASGGVFREIIGDCDCSVVFEQLQGQRVNRIIHLASLGLTNDAADLGQFEKQLDSGVYHLFHITKGILENRLKGPTELFVVTQYANEVTGEEPCIHPNHASLLAMGKVIAQEYPNLTFRGVDMDEETAFEFVLAEMMSAETEYRIAYRQGRRYKVTATQVPVNGIVSQPYELQQDGAYLITGGLGSLGLKLAEHFVRRKPDIAIALIARSGLPQRSEWEHILRDKGLGNKTRDRIEQVLKLERMGAKVEVLEADVADLVSMERTMIRLREKYGSIRGVVHSAGVAGDGLLLTKDFGQFKEVIRAKVHGTWVLEQLIDPSETEFVIGYSSINALIGGFGQSDYAAANAYMDAAAYRFARKGMKAVAIQWPAWKEIGMAVDKGAVSNIDGIMDALTTEEALEYLDVIIGTDYTNVMPGRINQEAFQMMAINTMAAGQTAGQPAAKEADRVNHPQDDIERIEQTIVETFAEVLGLESVDVYDSFFALGGDSIVATHLYRALDEKYEGKIDIADIFTYTTPAELGACIRANMEGSKPVEAPVREDLLEWALQRLASGEISIDEMEAIVGDKK
ncbi:SDR family oxidoreductase [Paenibacillus sp. RRE4]|uniref:SDR family oxidoreductase n=1 Tax=Paenibacillus sp. RRE4 TaxID=2962587 RepID=UPI002881EC3A|nr:SDR family oxidoreductase [Paenibacillus sp. RRE4]MDT0125323.1 SDR family oxidoreductase [Paenibacillus sp. RRE4]